VEKTRRTRRASPSRSTLNDHNNVTSSFSPSCFSNKDHLARIHQGEAQTRLRTTEIICSWTAQYSSSRDPTPQWHMTVSRGPLAPHMAWLSPSPPGDHEFFRIERLATLEYGMHIPKLVERSKLCVET
jgi:hypothetical protein